MANRVFELDRFYGRKFFGNNAGITGNISGRLVMKLSRGLGKGIDKKLVEDIRRTGVKQLGQPYDEDYIEEISEKFAEIIMSDDEDVDHYTVDGREVTRGIASERFDYARKFPEVEKLVTDDLAETLRSYFGTEFRPVRIAGTRIFHIPDELEDERETARAWHYDSFTPDHIRLFVFLSDDPDGETPTVFMDRSDSVQVLEDHGYENMIPRSERLDEKYEVTRFFGEKGTAALANPNTHLHRGSNPPEGGYRDLISISFAPTTGHFESNWMDNPGVFGKSRDAHRGLKRLFYYR